MSLFCYTYVFSFSTHGFYSTYHNFRPSFITNQSLNAPKREKNKIEKDFQLLLIQGARLCSHFWGENIQLFGKILVLTITIPKNTKEQTKNVYYHVSPSGCRHLLREYLYDSLIVSKEHTFSLFLFILFSFYPFYHFYFISLLLFFVISFLYSLYKV